MLAVDVALLPPADLLDATIALNRALHGEPDGPIVLNASDCLPHVSLAMGCVRENEVPGLTTAIETIAAAHPRVELVPVGFHVRQSQSGYVVASAELERTAALQALHEAVMRAVEPYLTRDATPDMFIEPDSISSSTIRWVNEYATAASFTRFWPHLTLGAGTLPDGLPLPMRSRASRLAICHLGPHCTCRRILAETALRDR